MTSLKISEKTAKKTAKSPMYILAMCQNPKYMVDTSATAVNRRQTVQTSIVISGLSKIVRLDPRRTRAADYTIPSYSWRPCFGDLFPPLLSRSYLSMANNRVPINYEVPSFPSLYDPLPSHHQQAYYLYYTKDIWRFTLFWTLVFYAATHLTVAGCAMITQCRNWTVIWIIPLVYSFIAALEGLLAGSIVGLV